MNTNSIVTLTLGDQAENHAGMEKLGELAQEGDGFNLEDLQKAKQNLEEICIECEIISLDLYQKLSDIDVSIPPPQDAYILIIRDGVNKILQNCSDFNQQDMFNEHISLDVDKKAWMRGKVVNKHARWNLCFDSESRDPDYENKKGRIISYDEIPVTKILLSQISSYVGPKAENLKGEGNYYYNKSKCGIGFHGDSERRKVIGIRLGDGESSPLHYQWFSKSEAVGERIIIPLNGGDMYIMSEKAVGTDWKKKKIYTLRHATGCETYIKI
jgi:hypothetical protein